MSGQLISLADASRLLVVSPERVRQLVVAGDLPAQRFGNAWAVPRDAVIARRHAVHRGGRPLGARRAWGEIISGDVDLTRPGRYLRRASVLRCEISSADIEALPQIAGAMLSGVRAAIELGAPLLAADEHDLYIEHGRLEDLQRNVAMVADPLGRVRLRIVDDAVWEAISQHAHAPAGAVALDLLDSADPRHWIAAERLVVDG